MTVGCIPVSMEVCGDCVGCTPVIIDACVDCVGCIPVIIEACDDFVVVFLQQYFNNTGL